MSHYRNESAGKQVSRNLNDYLTINQMELSGKTPEFINKKYTRKRALMPQYEDKSTREHLAGVAT